MHTHNHTHKMHMDTLTLMYTCPHINLLEMVLHSSILNQTCISPWQQPSTFPLVQTIYKMQRITSCDHFYFQPITCQDTGNAPLQNQQILQEIGSYSDHMISSDPTIYECYKPVSIGIHDYWIIALR